MNSKYTGIYKTGNKESDRVDFIQVTYPTDSELSGELPMPLHDYINKAIKPNYENLPWLEDYKP